MPAKLLQEVQLPSGEVIWARVAVEGPTNVGNNPLRNLDIDNLRSTISGVTASLRDAIHDLEPDHVEVEFGLELAVKGGKLISALADAGVTASVKVNLAWDKQTKPAVPAAQPPAAVPAARPPAGNE